MPFNPISSITGNGVPSQVSASFTTGTSYWNISSQDLPGLARVGTFPNPSNLYTITPQSINYTWPYRGGKNIANSAATSVQPGVIGVSSIGVLLFSPVSTIRAAGQNSTIWTLNNKVADITGSDIYGGTVNSSGAYYYNNNSFITNNAWGTITSSTWETSYVQSNGHSKIIGWAADGYPIYGPYGYINPLSTSTGVSRMVSGYVSTIKPFRPTNRSLVVNGAVVSSKTVNVYSTNGIGPGTKITGSEISGNVKIVKVVGSNIQLDTAVTLSNGSQLTAAYPLGIFVEDWVYSPTTSTMLDSYNGRYCVTPDYPLGTYAYFTTQDSGGVPTYPYIVGPEYYGSLIIDSTSTTLSNIIPSVGVVSPSFNSSIKNYTVDVINTATSIRLTPIATDLKSSIKFNTSSTILSGVSTPPISLIIGNNTSTFTVTSQYQTTSTYTVNVNRLKNAINTLTSLSINIGGLTPSFNFNQNTYTGRVVTGVETINVTAVKSNASSSIKINGITATSGVAKSVEVNYGINPINIAVTSELGTTNTYVINLTRESSISLLSGLETSYGSLTPTFDSNTYFYNVIVPNSTSTIKARAFSLDSGSVIKINSIETASGVYSNNVALNPGDNPIGIVVNSSNNKSNHYYRINVYRNLSNNANLESLNVDSGVLNRISDTLYSVNLINDIRKLIVTPVAQEVGAKISVNSNLIALGETSSTVNLFTGINNIGISVVSPSGSTTKTYTLSATRAPNSVSKLSNLVVANAIIYPRFGSETYEYVSTVSNSISYIEIIPTSQRPESSINVNNISVVSGNSTGRIPLTIGSNNIVTKVTAEDGITTSTYSLAISRNASPDSSLSSLVGTNIELLTPTFSSNNFNYTSNASYLTTTTDITAYATEPNAKITINGGSSTAGIATKKIDLDVGNNTIIVDVLSADTNYTSVYSIRVNRSANNDSSLASLNISQGSLVPEFSSTTQTYDVLLGSNIKSVKVTAATTDQSATISIAGQSVNSLQESAPINLYSGINSVPVVVTAADRSSVTGYTINFNRNSSGLSNDATLSSIENNVGSISPKFDPNVFSYSLQVDNTVESIKFKPIVNYPLSKVFVNDVLTTSSTFSQNLNLIIGNTPVKILVVAEDRITKNTYNITVKRPGTGNAFLKNLLVSTGQLNPLFNKKIYNYTINVPNLVNAVSVKPILDDPIAQQSLSGLGLTPGLWAPAINLNVGSNIVSVEVLAADFETNAIYTVNFIRGVPSTIDPVNLFSKDNLDQLYATTLSSGNLKIFTTDSDSRILKGAFPNEYNDNAITSQNIELIVPYKGGRGDSANDNETTNRSPNSLVGMTVAGVPLYDPNSGILINGLYNTTWTLDAVATGVLGPDIYGGQPNAGGTYHYRDNSFITNNAWTNLPAWQSFTHADGHSKIIGFALDGYPIYGPYGYTTATNSYSGISLMKSGYTLQNSNNRPLPTNVTITVQRLLNIQNVNTTTNLHVGMRLTGDSISTTTNLIIERIDGLSLTLNQAIRIPLNSVVTASFDLGAFIEDWKYTNPPNATLDSHNGRYCVTPDYPLGTYAYFATNKDNSYPYIIGDTYYGSTTSQSPVENLPPIWDTPIGFIVTATETVSISRSVSAAGATSYKLISGLLPSGLSINTSTGIISGTPSIVYQTITSEFVIRASNQYGVSDRKFYIDVQGATAPQITTPGGKLYIGPDNERYLVNNQYVDFKFTATADIIPSGKSLIYYIEDGDGILPPGLILSQDGHLSGQVKDTLSLFYRSASNGTFSNEGYDSAPFEHDSLQAVGVSGLYVNKIYKFSVTVFNGVGKNKRAFEIDVYDPRYFTNTPDTYPITPQWLTGSNLGHIRANTSQVIQIETYDCDPGNGEIYYQLVSGSLPPGLTLSSTGIISGYIGYTPNYTTTYSATIRVNKQSNLIGSALTYRNRTFTLTLLGTTEQEIYFVTDELLGTLFQGQQSELYIEADTKTNNNIVYSLVSGSLPPGLSMLVDGTIKGQLTYNNLLTSDTTYSFVVKAKNNENNNEIIKTFKIIGSAYTGNHHARVILQPLLSQDSKDYFNEFITNETIFDQNLIYRPYDEAFGVQNKIQFILEYGITPLSLADYTTKMRSYFYRKKLYFGDVKSAFAVNSLGGKDYEVIYVELIDHSENDMGESPDPSINANSIDNMRGNLENLEFPIAEYDEYLLPRFMRTIQDNNGIPLGRILCMPLCYCLPGASKIILSKIKSYDIDFKLINFDIDRLIILNSLDNSSAKYLLFPNREVLQ